MFLILANIGNCQSYKPFNFDKGIWYSKYVTKGGWFGVFHGPVYVTDSVKYFCNGDTLISDILYKKLFCEGYSSSQNVSSTYFSDYLGAIRNDTVNRKVYFLGNGFDSNYEGSKIPIYDFDLGIGDTTGTSCLESHEIITVTSIDSVLYCNQYYRRFNTSSGDDIIEGIGSVFGLFPLNCPLANAWLICYQELDNNECIDCNIFTLSAHEYPNLFKIYPNPTSGKIRIVPDKNIQSVEIFDIQGKMVDEITFDFENIVIKDNGIFIFKIKTNDKVFTYKVVKN